MYKDFKENYIEQQKKQAEARQARLAKIGMGTPAAATRENASQRTAVSSGGTAKAPRSNERPAVRYINESPSEKPPVRKRPAAPVPAAASASNQQSAKKQPVQPSQVQRSAAADTNATKATQNAPVKRPDGEREAKTPTAETKRPASAQAARPNQGQPARPEQSRASRPQSQTSRPAQAQTSRPSQGQSRATSATTGAQRPASRPAGGSASYNSRRMAATDSDIFKNDLSDSESRAMMFALTGKAEQPADGGDVDIINLGRISAPKKKKYEKKKKSSVGAYIGRTLTAIVSLVLFVVIVVFASVGVIAHGPSETVRDLLVQSAMQASATKWVPYIFLPAETVDGIINKSEEVVQDIVSLEDYNTETAPELMEDEWANAKDGMIFETVSGSTFKAYVLLVKDPSRVFCGTSTDDFSNSKAGVDVFQAAERYGAVACINAGEFLDNGGHGSGYAPLGLTYSQGKCVFRDNTPKTFMGFDNENRLIVREGMTEAEADELGIRDAVCFQNNNTLIQKEGDNIILSYEDGNAGTSQRTAIGQREDGTVILIVTDGRSASSLGATHNDMIDLMVSYGAVTAGMLDGGSSAMMYYEDYYTKYGYDVSKLDEYQKMGLVNNYKAFTEPRKIPTFFMVKPE